MEKNKLGITELVLRDAHQSLFATRMRIDDMLPIAEKLDNMGYWSVETWGGATFDSCIRYLGEDPWERLRILKKAMPKTPHQMLFRAQNILGYRHYADDVVRKFVERCVVNGMDVFRIFDAMNDIRNFKTAIEAVKENGKHAQGALSYTVSPVHTLDKWVEMAEQLQDYGCHSICIKDMAGLLKPYDAYELISRLKTVIEVPIALHSHATTGLSTPTLVKAAEAGIDMVDTAISSMSMTYGHSPTETLVSIYEDTDRATGLDLEELEEVAQYFRPIRKKYAKWEGSLQGVDARILIAQVPGGMLTNMESQLKEQGAGDKLDEVLEEIPRVRKDLGYIPLVTPTSQIVGTQAVLNVLTGERYKSITKETAGVLKGEYGSAAAPMNAELQAKVLDGKDAITVRPADLLEPEMDKLSAEFDKLANQHGFRLADDRVDDVLTYALFPQIGLKFLKNRDNPDAFEPEPLPDRRGSDKPEVAKAATPASVASNAGPASYVVNVDGKDFNVRVAPSGAVESATPVQAPATDAQGSPIHAPLSGNIFKVLVKEGDHIDKDDVVMILEAMKMETEVRSTRTGIVNMLVVKEGDSVAVGDTLMSVSA